MKETAMGRAHGRSGGGIEGRNVVNTSNRKCEPVSHGVSVGAVSRLGGMVSVDTPHKAIYNKVAFTTPIGPTDNTKAGPGANRMVMRAGSQSATPRVSDAPRSKPHW
jgi:hypothetical protein